MTQHSQLIGIDINHCQELVHKFPVAGNDAPEILADALAKQTISQDAYIEITAKGSYLFTETPIIETATRSCCLQ